MKRIILLLFLFLLGFINCQSQVGGSKVTPYDKSLDRFINGVYGYDPNLTIEQNDKLYHDNGYNISYKVKDSTIYMIAFAIILVVVFFSMGKKKRQEHDEKYETVNEDYVE